MIKSPRRILVTGATGKTGRLVVDRLAVHHERPIVRVLVRQAEQAEPFEQRGFEVALGDAHDETTSWADSAIRDVDVVLSTFGGTPFTAENLWNVDYAGTQRLLAAARIAQIEQYIFVSTLGLRRPRSVFYPLSILFYPKLLAEDAIRRSGIPYTILRPGGLVDTYPAQGARITRTELADACVSAIGRSAALNKIFELSAARRAELGADWVFGVAVRDQGSGIRDQESGIRDQE